MATSIHPTAIIDKGASVGEGVTISPFVVVEDNVVIGDGTRIGPHAVIAWGSRIGSSCQIFNGASIGNIPQDLKFRGEETLCYIGNNTIIREFCTIHRGTAASGRTAVGNNCALLAYCHVAHDAIVGNNVIMSNCAALAGHVTVEDYAGIGANVAVHQFCRIGQHSFIGANMLILKDVIPYSLVGGEMDNPRIAGINKVGLERKGFDEPRRRKLKNAYKILFRDGLNVKEACDKLRETSAGDKDIMALVDFITGSEQRGIYRMLE